MGDGAEEDSDGESASLSKQVGSPQISTLVHVAINEIASSSAAFLMSKTPPHLRAKPLCFTPYTISLIKQHQHVILDDEPQTEREAALIVALQEAEERDAWWK